MIDAQVGKHMFASTQFSRSEEHTSELQSQSNLVCRLLLEKKNSPTLPPVPVRTPKYGDNSDWSPYMSEPPLPAVPSLTLRLVPESSRTSLLVTDVVASRLH